MDCSTPYNSYTVIHIICSTDVGTSLDSGLTTAAYTTMKLLAPHSHASPPTTALMAAQPAVINTGAVLRPSSRPPTSPWHVSHTIPIASTGM